MNDQKEGRSRKMVKIWFTYTIWICFEALKSVHYFSQQLKILATRAPTHARDAFLEKKLFSN
jgi:hypothetical protein